MQAVAASYSLSAATTGILGPASSQNLVISSGLPLPWLSACLPACLPAFFSAEAEEQLLNAKVVLRTYNEMLDKRDTNKAATAAVATAGKYPEHPQTSAAAAIASWAAGAASAVDC